MTSTASEGAKAPRVRVLPKVTVVVPVRDGGDQLREVVAALEAQSLGSGDFEVVIADDGSRDGAVDLLARRDWLRVETGPRRNSYAARNMGASVARADALAFCDADCRPEPRWLEEGLASLTIFDVVGGAVRFVVPDGRTVWTLLDIDTFLDQERAVRNGTAVSANLFVRRSVFEMVGGFDDTLPNQGDFDFVKRAVAAGARLGYSEQAAVRHPTRDDRGAFLRKAWNVNRRYAAREARSGGRPEALKLRSLVPVIQPIRSRRRVGRSLTLDRHRLAESGVSATPAERVKALPLQYLVLPYLATAAQFQGWIDGRKASAPASLARRARQPWRQ